MSSNTVRNEVVETFVSVAPCPIITALGLAVTDFDHTDPSSPLSPEQKKKDVFEFNTKDVAKTTIQYKR
jgi:hypothetical protein